MANGNSGQGFTKKPLVTMKTNQAGSGQMEKIVSTGSGTKDTKNGLTITQTIRLSIFPRATLTMQIILEYGFLIQRITTTTMAKAIPTD